MDFATPAPLLSCLLRGLYVITDERFGGGHLPIVRAALAGGAKIIQLRDKTTPPRALLQQAHEIRRLTREAGALFLVNDRLDLALLCEADGVHLGPDDWPLPDVRRVVERIERPDFWLGASCSTPEAAQQAEKAGANYIGAGAVFGTTTKADAGAPIGLEGLRAIVTATNLPVAAIGALNAQNLVSTLAAGAKMACVISALAGEGDETAMQNAARQLVALAS